MQKVLSAVTLFLMSSWTYAAMKEVDQATSAAPETVDVVYVLLFLILFFGSIIGFFIFMWWNNRNKKQEQ